METPKQAKRTVVIGPWPTLQGRLGNSITSEKEALEQLQKSLPLSEYGKKRLKKLQQKRKDP